MRLLAAALALALALAASCERVAFAPSLPYDEYRAAYEQALCEWYQRCAFEESVDACRASRSFDRPGHYRDAAIAAGTILYHGDKAFACIEEMAGLGCELGVSFAAAASSCLDVFEGAVPPEEPCLVDDECALDGVCGFQSAGDAPMCITGRCRILPGPLEIGDPCGVGIAQCGPDSFCAFDPNTGQSTVCTARLAIGEPCADGACAAGSYCAYDLNTYEPTVCTALPAEGEPCGDTSCAPGLTCASSQEGVPPTCVAPAPLGAACLPNGGTCDHVSAWCNPATATCELRGGAGTPCGPGIGNACAPYTMCNWDTQVCVALAGEGQKCGCVDDYCSMWIACAGDLRCGGDGGNVCVFAGTEIDACEPPAAPEEPAA